MNSTSKSDKSPNRNFKKLIGYLSDAVVILDPEGKPSYASAYITSLLGYSVEEILDLDIFLISHPEDHSYLKDLMQKSIQSPEVPVHGTRVRIRHKDGSWRYMEGAFTNLLDDPEIGGIICNFRDVTERIQAEEALMESEQKYRAFFENSLDGILLTTSEGTILDANPSAEMIFRMSEEEIRKAGRWGILDVSDQRTIDFLEEREKTGEARGEVTMLRKGGNRFPAELTSSFFKYQNGARKAAVVIRDISERKKIEEELRKSQERYRLLFERGPLPSILYEEHNFKILEVNQAAVNHYGYSREEFLQMTILQLRREEDIPDLLSFIKSAREEGKELRFGTAVHLKKDGSLIQVEVHGFHIKSGDHEYTKILINDVTEKVTAFSRLKELTSKLQTAERIAKLGYWELDIKTDKIFWTDEVYNIWERDKEIFEPSLDNFIASIHSDDLELFEKEQEATLSGIRDLDIEHRILMPDGTVKWVRERGKLRRDHKGQPLTFEGTVQDITRQKLAIDQLVQSEARLRSLLESQTSYAVRVDMEGNYTYCNRKFRDDFGWIYEGGNVVGNDSMKSVETYHHSRLEEVIHKCIEHTNTVYQVEIDKPAKNGGVKTTLWDMLCITNSRGEPIELQCIGIDITDRIKAEQESRFRANLLNKIGQAVVATNLEGTITYWNRAASKIYGWSEKEALGKQVIDLIPTIHSRDQGRKIMEKLSEGKTWTGEFLVKHRDGTEFPVLVTDSPVYDEDDNLIGVIGISTDITDRKKAEEELLKLNENLKEHTRELVTANKGLEQFSFIVSHNLRAPVANIIGLGDLLQNEEYPPEVHADLMRELFSNTKRLDTIITDLNEILQLKVNMDSRKEAIDLEKLVSDIKAGISNLIRDGEVQILTHFKEVPKLTAVKSYLHSIFYNLITNSIKYSRPGIAPVIEISTMLKENTIILKFRDNGLGIDVTKKGDQIFGLYKRFHHHIEGKGMGLFMVKTQVEMLGGSIAVFSAENKGTEFIIELPVKG